MDDALLIELTVLVIQLIGLPLSYDFIRYYRDEISNGSIKKTNQNRVLPLNPFLPI